MKCDDYIIEFLSPTLCFGPVTLEGAQGLGIPAGLTAVVGPNGAGKTTLGYVIERGRYGFGNRVRFAREGMRVKVLAFTDIHSFTGVDVLRYDQRLESSENEYVPTVAEIFGEALHTDLWRDMAERLSLRGAEEKKINYLSSGELRKLLIINALLTAPEILVLDNPFIGLDARSRGELRDALTALRDRGLHIILLLCDPDEVPEGTDAVLRLNECRFEGLADDVGDSSADSYRRLKPSLLQGDVVLPPAPEDVPEHEVAFSIRGGHAGYGGRDVFSGVDWEVRRGERWMLTGPNGSGKSLLLSMVCGDNPQAYANDIVIFDHKRGSGESIWDIKNNIGYVCPEMQLYFRSRLPVRGIVIEGMRPVLERFRPHTAEEAAIAEAWLECLGIGSLADREFSTLSSSEQRMVLLARAFARQPAMLVLDEPFQGLDPTNKERVRRVIDAMMEARAASLIFVTHYPDELPSCVMRRMSLVKE
ncbi:ATP-binding cassette domain-containing protein [Duncaniella muris]|uniref:ATP-binding cassette domain-containing protein n=1 Tax=Duncaniella muris TaxID=2094150 RepID=UPI002628C2D8|nr:ATP-binding cassette domain-containing protein [Duncaniella muris]